MNLACYCLTNASPDPGAVALEVVGPNGIQKERWTYGEIERTILSVAGGLTEKGLKRGDRILLRPWPFQ